MQCTEPAFERSAIEQLANESGPASGTAKLVTPQVDAITLRSSAPEGWRYSSSVGLGRPLASQLGRKVKTQTSLPGFDSPHDAVQENGTYGRHGKAVGCVSPTALLFLSNAFVDIGAGPRRRQERSQNGPNEQFIGMTHQVTAGLLGLISVGVFVTPMPKKCRGKTTRSHLRVANRQRSSASLPPNASN
jgi:hypothetical protein